MQNLAVICSAFIISAISLVLLDAALLRLKTKANNRAKPECPVCNSRRWIVVDLGKDFAEKVPCPCCSRDDHWDDWRIFGAIMSAVTFLAFLVAMWK